MPKQLCRLEKRAATVVTLAIALPVAAALWRAHLDAPPVLNAPAIVLPSPNAYDYFAKAGRLLKATEAATPGCGAIDPVTDTNYVTGLTPAQLSKRYPTAAKVAWAQKNAPALAALRQGLNYPFAEPPRTPGSPFPVMYGPLRGVARLLVIESHSRSERGDWDGAAQSAVDNLRTGHSLENGGDMMASYVGSAINAIGRRDLNTILPHLSAAAARASAASIETLGRNRSSAAAMLTRDKWRIAHEFCAALHSPTWRADLYSQGAMASLLAMGTGTTDRWLRLRLIFAGKQRLLDSLLRLQDAQIKRAALTYPQQVALPDLKSDDPVLVDIVWGISPRYNWLAARDETGNVELMTQLALRAYKLEHGRWPASLQQLTPAYLNKVPLDPFASGQPLHYKLLASGPLLYSIGPDGIDNGGKAIDTPAYGTSTRGHRLTEFDSKGDVVAGFNDQ